MDAYLNLMRFRMKHFPEMFPNLRIAFLDNALQMSWKHKYPEWLEDKTNFPPGALDYERGELPSYMKLGKRWRVDVDWLYGVVHIGPADEGHWFGMIVDIPKGEITIVDSSPHLYTHEEIEAAVLPYAHIIPSLVHYLATPEEKLFLSTEPYRVLERDPSLPRNKPPAGDCGVYALKFLELHALGKEIPEALQDDNMKNIRMKMACDIFEDVFRYGSSTSALQDGPDDCSDYHQSVEMLPNNG